MKILLERGDFLKALSHAQGVVEKRTAVPILANVLLEAKDDRLTLTSTDLELAVVEVVGASVETEGRLTVSAHMLFDIVRKLPDGAQISLNHDVEKGRLTITAGRGKYELATLSADEFPRVSVGELPHHLKLDAKQLQRLLERTRFAMSVEEAHYTLNGIHLSFQKGDGDAGAVHAAATDTHRLAHSQISVPLSLEATPGIILSRKTVTELQKLLSDASGEVDLSLSDTQVSCAFGDVKLVSRLVDGTFPDYQGAIPQNNVNRLSLSATPFLKALDRVATLCEEKNKGVRLSLQNDRLTLVASGRDAGAADEEMEVVYDGAPLEVGFNVTYLMDVARQTGEGELIFEFSDTLSPTLVRDAQDASTLYVLMPLRV
ncbi:MAG: DNA polymerase III subunit beta [Candidatus Puniceispirillum sp.]|nr:DNA polymerase III subunit beta [Candidatus Puniceispirillum sp.]